MFSEGIEKLLLRKIFKNRGLDDLYFCIIYDVNIGLGDCGDEWAKEVVFEENISLKKAETQRSLI